MLNFAFASHLLQATFVDPSVCRKHGRGVIAITNWFSVAGSSAGTFARIATLDSSGSLAASLAHAGKYQRCVCTCHREESTSYTFFTTQA